MAKYSRETGIPLRCPVCEKGCIQPAREVLEGIEQRYQACPACAQEPNLDKSAMARRLPERLERCHACGRATLDAVMLDVLRLLQECGLRDENDTLRSVGSPLIEVGYPLAYSPRLGPRSLIISGDRYSRKAAKSMLKQIPEIKGVIQSQGVAGVVDSEKKPLENVLLAGCDMRCDICQSLFGETVIYKSQSRIHIEFSRQTSPKMRILEQLYFHEKLRDVVDGLCGPGTLGLMCVLAGARRVVLNDAWHASVQNVLLNLEANKSLLGIDEIEYPESSGCAVGNEPVLVGQAHGSCEIEVYHGDLKRLFSRAKPAETCLIDHFPGANTTELERACRCCKEIIII